MKIKHIIVLLIILVLLSQFVSAGFFEDVFNKITGRVTEEVVEVTIEPEPVVEQPETIKPAPEPEPVVEEQQEIIEPAPEPIPEEPVKEEEPIVEEVVEEEKPVEECLKEGETYMPGDDKQCCAGLKRITITSGDGITCTLPMGYVCTAFCGDGKCEGEYENACSCPGDCKETECLGLGEQINPSLGPEYSNLGKECCGGLRLITYSGNYDENCNHILLVGAPSGVCTKCGDGVCGSRETKCNCPEDCKGEEPECPPIPEGIIKECEEKGGKIIKKFFDSRGCPSVVECEYETERLPCPSVPPEVIEKCEETGGKVVKRLDSRGCSYIDCEYVSRPPGFVEPVAECPTEDLLREMEKKCFDIGLNPTMIKEGECKFIKCSEKPTEITRPCVENVEEVRRTKEKCAMAHGRIVKNFDPAGCPMTVCVQPEVECERRVPPEANKKCEIEGGDLVIKRDDKGCIRFVECVRRGQIDIVYEEIEEIPPAAKLLSIALKLESLKIEFDKMIKKLKGIANYYEETGNTAEADKFRKIIGLFSSAQDKIENVKVKLRERAKDITKEDLEDIKHDIKYISEAVMQDALYIILGGEVKLEGSTGVTEEGYTNCGRDDKCFAEAFRLCEPIVFTPESNTVVKIHGVDEDGEACFLQANYKDLSMSCKIKDYALAKHNDPNTFIQYCEGDFVEYIKEEMKKAPPKAEPLTMCTLEDEGASKKCKEKGGILKRDFISDKNCWIYTDCIIGKTEEPIEGVPEVEEVLAESVVKVYSTPTCPHCDSVKIFLQQNGIGFKEIDVTKNPSASQELEAKTGGSFVPTVDVNGKIVVGYDEEKLKELLQISEGGVS